MKMQEMAIKSRTDTGYTAEVMWHRQTQKFIDGRYSRRHTIHFDGGLEVAGSSSPHTVPVPYSAPGAMDPEEALVSALSSCHMLWFLSIAAKAGFMVDKYHDSAVGYMGQDADGRTRMMTVLLRPEVTISGDRQPTPAEFEALHHQAHDDCYIANSVKAEVRCEAKLISISA